MVGFGPREPLHTQPRSRSTPKSSAEGQEKERTSNIPVDVPSEREEPRYSGCRRVHVEKQVGLLRDVGVSGEETSGHCGGPPSVSPTDETPSPPPQRGDVHLCEQRSTVVHHTLRALGVSLEDRR